MKISSSLRKDALKIFYAGLRAVEPDVCMPEHVHLAGNSLEIGKRVYDLNTYKDIYVIGFGKASGFMAMTLERLLMNRITAGIVTVRYGYGAPCKIIRVNEAGHPIPDKMSVRSTNDIIHLLEGVKENDLVICLISGGGSALFELPCDSITLEEIQELIGLLLKSGVSIDELNAIRKHISKVKGGRLAKMCKGEVVSLIVSDVVNDPLDTIASGPTSPDYTTFSDCERVLIKYGLSQKVPKSIKEYIQMGLEGKVEETPKVTDKLFDKVYHMIIGNNRMALHASCLKASELGYNTCILSSYIKGEAREVAKVFGALAKEIRCTGGFMKRPACIIAGGETTVTVKGNGCGGRNLEFILSAAIEVDNLENVTVFSAGTDGTDGNTDAAGAVADGHTVMRAKEMHMVPDIYLMNNNSYPFFKNLDNLIITGPTRTNVMDIMVLLVE